MALAGKSVCVAGKLTISHSAMKEKVAGLGGKVTGSVTKSTDFLVCTPHEATRDGAKVVAAKRLGVRMVSEAFITMAITNKNVDPSSYTIGASKRSIRDVSHPSPFPPRANIQVLDTHKRLKMNAESSRQKVEQIFHTFADPCEPNVIGYQGMIELCDHLKVSPTDIVMLILAWKFNAKMLCKFTKTEFVDGMIGLECDSIANLCARLPSLRSSINTSPDQFRQFYNFCFPYSCADGQKSLALESATQVWGLLLRDRYAYLDLWLSFLTEKHDRSITKDTWKLFLEFTITVKSFEMYGDDEAWPVLIDNFVDYARGKLAMQT